ncbi:hypothetical protein AHAS_Ahas19G0161600 [Arachis hypogaea]
MRSPKLYAALEKYMVHGPCDHYNCRKRTIIDDASFPKYTRRDDARIAKNKNFEVDNSFIVPYSPSLLLKYAYHINVEYTFQTLAIKYLFKYLHKGNDRVTTAFYQNGTSYVNEIRNYTDCRCISACETA